MRLYAARNPTYRAVWTAEVHELQIRDYERIVLFGCFEFLQDVLQRVRLRTGVCRGELQRFHVLAECVLQAECLPDPALSTCTTLIIRTPTCADNDRHVRGGAAERTPRPTPPVFQRLLCRIPSSCLSPNFPG